MLFFGKRGKNSQNPKFDLGVVLELEHMKSLRFFWLWSTADQKNSEAAPLRCAMAACCHPSNSPSTAPALTFWPNSESKNCRGHPGIGFCQYETLTCPILKRICLEKYDISRSSYVSHNFHLQFTGAACHSGVHFWPLASWQFCNNWISQICCENQLCIVLHLENFFSAQRRAIFRNIHEHMGRSRQIFCIDPFCNGFSAHRTHDSVTKTQNFVTSVPCPGTFLLLSFALLRLFLVFPKVYAAVYLSSWAENRLAKLIME